MRKVDRLSRRPDWKVKNNNKNQKLIKEKWVWSLVEVVIKGLEVYIVEKTKNTKEKDKEIVRVVEEMKKTRVKVLRDEDWQVEEELVLKEEKEYVLKVEELRIEIIQLYHNVLVVRYKER